VSDDRCQECGQPADPRYDLDFTDVDPSPAGVLHFCGLCGPQARVMNDLLLAAAAERGAPFLDELEEAVTAAEAERKRGAH